MLAGYQFIGAFSQSLNQQAGVLQDELFAVLLQMPKVSIPLGQRERGDDHTVLQFFKRFAFRKRLARSAASSSSIVRSRSKARLFAGEFTEWLIDCRLRNERDEECG